MKWILCSGGVALAAALVIMAGTAPPLRTLALYMLWGAMFALTISLLRYVARGR